MKNKDSKLIGTVLGEKHLQMLEEIENQTGQTNYSEIIRTSIFYYYTKIMKDASVVRKVKNRHKPSVEEEIRDTIKRKEVYSDIKAEKVMIEGKRIAKLLDGEVFEENGVWYCRFTCYEYMNPTYVHEGSMTLPLEELSDELVDIKWKGGKEKIKEVLAKKQHEKKE